MNDTTTEPRRGFHIRWWMWFVVILLLPITTLAWIRIQGFNRFHAVQRELHAAGFATTPVEFVALGPTVDANRQARLWRLVNWHGPTWTEYLPRLKTSLPFNELSEQRPPNTVDIAKRDQTLLDAAKDLDELATLLAEGPCITSVYGWIERDPVRLPKIKMTQDEIFKVSNMGAIRGITWALSARAYLATDPLPDLQRLDAFQHTLDHPGVLIDAMVSLENSRLRDNIVLWLATRGRIGDVFLQRWAAEPPMQCTWWADGLAGQRCLYQEPIIRLNWDIVHFVPWSDFPHELLSFAKLWPLQGYDLAVCISSTARSEARLRNQSLPTKYAMPFDAPPQITNRIRPNLPTLQEDVITATEAATTHRLMRCAALISATYRRTGTLSAAMPLNAPASRIDDNMPAIVYERLSSSRFRVGINPVGPLPPAIPTDRWYRNHVSTIGTPPSTKADDIRRWSIEIDLDAILIPPPEKPMAKPESATTLPNK